MSLLEVRGLGVNVRSGTALVRDISFAVDAGDRIGLIGESGSGKSLTALAILGLLPFGLESTGSVMLGGTQVIGVRDGTLVPLRGRLACLIFQEPLSALDPLMKLGHQLAEPIARHQHLRGTQLRQAVLDALAEVRLRDVERIARSRSSEISGGQRQRVAIAMALACRPQLLIADEPTTALDVTVQSDVLDLLDGLVAERGMAMVFISHDLAVVSRMTDRVLLLREGEMVEEGTVAELLTSPRHPYTKAFAASAREIDAAFAAAVAGGAVR